MRHIGPVVLLAATLAITSCGAGKQPAEGNTGLTSSADPKKQQPDTVGAPSSAEQKKQEAGTGDAMFSIEKAEVSQLPVECRGCRVEAAEGKVLLVCTVRFAKQAYEMPVDDYCKLKIAEVAKEWSKIGAYGNLIARGDFQLRLEDGTMVPCSCLPGSAEQGGPPIQFKSKEGEGDWLMYVGYIRVLGAISKNAVPKALVWAREYDVALPAPPK